MIAYPTNCQIRDSGFFFIHPYTHILLPPFFLKASFDFDPILHHERHLCQSLCLSRSPALCTTPPLHRRRPPSSSLSLFLSFQPSSPHCLIAGSVLLCFSQHGKTLSRWGRNLSASYKQSWEKRKLSLPIPLSLSLLLCNLNFTPPLTHAVTSTSGFISASRCFLWQLKIRSLFCTI